MKRLFKRSAFALGLLVVTAGAIIGYREVKSLYHDWYSDTFIERATSYPSSAQPDQICLTWSADPRTSQTIQWRTDTSVSDGSVQWRLKGGSDITNTTVATRAIIKDRMLKSDPVVHRFTAEIGGLAPSTAYEYRVGSASAETWSEWSSFATAPEGGADFSFIYLGDPQQGLEYWGGLLHKTQGQHPSAAFYVIAGDLVSNGSWRNEWDQFFGFSHGVFDTKPIVPALGNHDYDRKATPHLYLETFALRENGPQGMLPERAYSFHYGNALFVILDSNEDIDEQTPWLREQLSSSDAMWKFAVFHHPAYSSAPGRNNSNVRNEWGALFDKYHLDMAFQGHDHAYLRTYPMRGGEPAGSATDGTYYVVSVSGTKYYEQEEHEYAEVAFANVSTYQTIDIRTKPDRLVYRSIDLEGNVLDELTIEK